MVTVQNGGLAAGLIVVAYAVEGGVAYYDVSNFTISVIQHLLLIAVAPPLLAMGAPLTLALQSSSPRTTTVLLKVLRGAPARLFTHPVVAFAGLMGTMYVFFLTPLYGFSERHPVLQAYLLLHFLVAGCLFWWPMVGKDLLPRRFGFGTRFVLVFVSVPFNAVLGSSSPASGDRCTRRATPWPTPNLVATSYGACSKCSRWPLWPCCSCSGRARRSAGRSEPTASSMPPWPPLGSLGGPRPRRPPGPVGTLRNRGRKSPGSSAGCATTLLSSGPAYRARSALRPAGAGQRRPLRRGWTRSRRPDRP